MINSYATGKSLYFRAPTTADVQGGWHEWFSDPELMQYLADRWWPNTVEAQMQFYESTRNSRDRLVLSICSKETGQHIGVCSLGAINWVHRYADVALVIGDKKHRNGANAIEALAMLLDIAFNRLNLENLKSIHMAANPHTPLLEKMFGFQEVGRFKSMYFHRGAYVDGVISQLGRAAWVARNEDAGGSTGSKK
jgi:ribosomal-protein-alanine N-acetyltransferase